jgi:hypothetical protein
VGTGPVLSATGCRRWRKASRARFSRDSTVPGATSSASAISATGMSSK